MNIQTVLKKLGIGGVLVGIVVHLTFLLVQLFPGGYEDFLQAQQAASGRNRNIDVDVALDGSIVDQYLTYMGWLAQGRLGQSFWYDEPVGTIVAEALPWTVFVMSIALFITFGVGISLGALMAYYEGSRFDHVMSPVATVLNSIPYYVAAIILLFLFGFQLEWVPTEGKIGLGVTPGFNLEFVGSVLHHAALPVLSYSLTAFGFRALAMRGNSIQVLGSNYTRVAMLRGLSDRIIALRYVARNAVLPMYTGMLIALGVGFGGSVILEEIFTYQGIGYYMYNAIIARDIPLMMGTFMVISLAVIVGLVFADLTYGYIDPRTVEGGTSAERSIRDRLAGIRIAVRNWRRKLGRWRRREAEEFPGPGGAFAGDAEESVFTKTADESFGRRERLRRSLNEYVVAPLRIVSSDRRAIAGLSILGVYVLMATAGTRLIAEPDANQAPRLRPPFESLAYPLGTDVTGTDLLSSIVHATPAMLEMVFAGAVIGSVVATIVGLVAGYSGGLVERVLTGITDTMLAIPGLPLVIVLAVVFEPSEPYLVGLLLVINAWGGTARQVHSQVLAIKEKSYIEASRVMMISKRTILFKDILPNILPFVFIKGVQMGRRVIFSAVALYFLGVLPTTSKTYNWGVTMNTAYKNDALYSIDAFHWIFVPMLAIIVFTYSLILLAQGMDQVFSPQVRARHASTDVNEDESGDKPTVGAASD